MRECIQPIATITTASGSKGEVRVRPLSRYFDEYVEERKLMLGLTPESSFDKSGRITKGLSSTRKTLSAADKRLMNAFVSKSPVRKKALKTTEIPAYLRKRED